MHWILDGYNLILGDEKLAKVARNTLEGARDELIREIIGARRLKREKVFLVFDGKSGGLTEEITTNLKVRFSKPGETADDVIKSMVRNYGKRSSVLVVSDDREIVSYAKECGAKVIGSMDFLSLARARESKRRELESFSEKPTASTKSDLELLKLFKEKKQ
jgi:hypothetical protein